MRATAPGRPRPTAPAGRRPRDRTARPGLLALVLALGIASGGCVGAGNATPPAPASAPAGGRPNPAPGAEIQKILPLQTWQRLPASPPARLEIPAIGVATDVVPLGLQADGSMQVPEGADYDRAGWFRLGPEPGALGPAVIAGHVDSRTGPSVFVRLHELRAGDQVHVQRADGRRLTFTVETVREYPKTGFPTEAVFGPVRAPALRLVTCGGEFDRAARSYRDNIVVSARLAGGA